MLGWSRCAGGEGRGEIPNQLIPSLVLVVFFLLKQWFVFILFYFSATALQPCFPLGSLVIPRQRSSEIDEGSKTRKEIPDHLQRSVVANLIAVAGSVGIEGAVVGSSE